MQSGYYSQHAGPLRAELGAAIPRDLMREFHRKSGWRHGIVAVRQFAILGLATWALVRFDNPLIWVPLAIVQGFTDLQLHDPPARGRAPHRLQAPPPGCRAHPRASLRDPERHLREPVYALASRPPRRARIGRGRSEASSPVAEDQQALVQAAVLLAGAVPDLLPGGARRESATYPRRAAAARSRPSGRCRSPPT